jgi:hypothetical protein
MRWAALECRLLSSRFAEAAVEHIAILVRARTRRSVLAVLVAVVAAILVSGCETSSTTTSGPTPVKCQVSVASPPMMEAAGGNTTVAVTAQPECAWTATTSANWITSLSPASGQGNGSVSFRVMANDGASVREGTVVVNNEQARVMQRAPCRYTLTPSTQTIATSGGGSTVTVATDSDCAWTATTDTNWISLAAPTNGTGGGVITFTVPLNPGSQRTGTIIVGGQRATVIQSASAPPANCNVQISPTSLNVAATGGAGTITVTTTQSTCAWSASSDSSWITLASGSSGTGSGSVTFSVAANTGSARTGTITLANRTFTVSQAAGATTPPPPPPACTYSISPPNQSAPAAASTGTVTVTTTAACAWTAISNVPAWLTVTSGAAGTGNGSVGFSVAANTGAARNGTLTIANQTFTVNQAAGTVPCTYSIAPASQNVDANANAGTVAVTAGAGCNWTATSGASWITVTSGASGAGNGSVGFSVAANSGGARTGTVTIADQVFTVNQAAFVAPCTYAIAPTNQNVPVLGGTGTVTVTTGSGCTWTAASNAPWLTITSGASGAGNGSVGFSAAANMAGSRTGTLTIAGQIFTVTQDAVVGPLSR